jgi:hypothetical protein
VPRYLTALFLALLLVIPAWAQESDSEDAAEDEEKIEVETVDEAEADEQAYADDDDDFRPSETIPADAPIAFPTDI